MRIGYFYCSSPEDDFPGLPVVPPMPGISCIESPDLPGRITFALNVSIVDLDTNDGYGLKFIVSHNNEVIPTENLNPEPFRQNHIKSKSGQLVHVYSFFESFKATDPGIYTITAQIFDSKEPLDIDVDNPTHSVECSIAIDAEWR